MRAAVGPRGGSTPVGPAPVGDAEHDVAALEGDGGRLVVSDQRAVVVALYCLAGAEHSLRERARGDSRNGD